MSNSRNSNSNNIAISNSLAEYIHNQEQKDENLLSNNEDIASVDFEPEIESPLFDDLKNKNAFRCMTNFEMLQIWDLYC